MERRNLTAYADIYHDPVNQPGNVLPPHFVESTLPRIGGDVIGIFDGTQLLAFGFTLPVLTTDGKLSYVIRGHRLDANDTFLLPEEWLDVNKFAAEDFTGNPISSHDGFTIASPNRRQAIQARELQLKIWGDPTRLYPYDLYKEGSGADTRLVALDEKGDTIGFLLGFIGAGKKWMGDISGNLKQGVWVESQLAAADEAHRHKGVVKKLKWEQYKQAEARGIRLIHWTVDPLQVNNAGLNYGLGAVAAEFNPGYYSFTNKLNRGVPASRFGIYWVVGGERAKLAREGNLLNPSFEELTSNENAQIIHPLHFQEKVNDWIPDGNPIFIEIPENWDEVQEKEPNKALLWRDVTDQIFQKIIGATEGKYVITARVFDGKTPYLTAQPFRNIVS